MKYTKEWLENFGACKESKEWASKNLKEGTVITASLLRELPEPLWAWWLACKLDGNNVLVWEAVNIAFRESAKVHPSLLPFSGKVSQESWETACSVSMDDGAFHASDAAFAASRFASGFAFHLVAICACQAAACAANHNDPDSTGARVESVARTQKELDQTAIRWLVENSFAVGE